MDVVVLVEEDRVNLWMVGSGRVGQREDLLMSVVTRTLSKNELL